MNHVYDSSNKVVTTIEMTKLDNDTSKVLMTMIDNFTKMIQTDNGSFKVNLTSRPLGIM